MKPGTVAVLLLFSVAIVAGIWIAGGIGITPFVPMIRSFKPDNGYDVVLYYAVSEKKEAVFIELFSNLSTRLLNFRTTIVQTKSQGRLTAIQISEQIKDFRDRDIFLCGPPSMMKSLREQFNKLGIRNSHIFSEEFSLD